MGSEIVGPRLQVAREPFPGMVCISTAIWVGAGISQRVEEGWTGEERESREQKEEHFNHLESSVHSSHYKSIQCVSIQLDGEGVKLVMRPVETLKGSAGSSSVPSKDRPDAQQEGTRPEETATIFCDHPGEGLRPKLG